MYSFFLYKSYIIILFLVCISILGKAQISDSLLIKGDRGTKEISTTDTIIASSNLGVDLRTPRTAMLRSVMLPGLGQFYNKQYWKIPVVYGALGALFLAAQSNSRNYREFRDAYLLEVQGLPNKYSGANIASLKQYRDDYRKNMELSYIAMVGIYGLNVLDAFVSAHLKSFDISEDIGMIIKPKFENIDLGYSNIPSAGISINIMLH
ncbi:MAG: hypothetical protein IPM04_03500 [Saprospiraceae bacterium]|nr:DUF5683 domain-containing protein [Candidatus Brachybacter algidus]MBK8746938.1 hypothetical protein [Candidatus Brachybacter algidus]